MKISIITINLNNAGGLEKTIESVVNQTYSDIEYIVIDGASTDNSVDIIKKYSHKIYYWISEPDTGIYNAMNKGIRKATGEYLLFLNSGDLFFDSKVLHDVSGLNYSSDLIYGNQFRIGIDGNRLNKFPKELTFYDFYTYFLGHNSTFIKRELFNLVGFYNEKYKIISDHEFFILAVCKYNCSYQYLDKTIAIMYDGGISNSIQYNIIGKLERINVLKEHFPAFISDYEKLYHYKYNSIYKRIKRIIKRILKISVKN